MTRKGNAMDDALKEWIENAAATCMNAAAAELDRQGVDEQHPEREYALARCATMVCDAIRDALGGRANRLH
jgi:hypothetical protein